MESSVKHKAQVRLDLKESIIMMVVAFSFKKCHQSKMSTKSENTLNWLSMILLIIVSNQKYLITNLVSIKF